MSDNIFNALKAAAEALEGSEHEAEIDALISMFIPRTGDPVEIATSRTMIHAQCGNCHLTWPAMAASSPVIHTAITAQRLAKCPRCFETKKVYIKNTE